MFKKKTVKELTKDLLVDIQGIVGHKVNMNMLMWRLYAQAKHIVENSDKKYHDLAALYHIADSDNQEYLRANTEIKFVVTSYNYLIDTIHLGYNLPVIIRDQDTADIMTYLVYVHARNIGYDHFAPKNEAKREEPITMIVSVRRINDDVERKRELNGEQLSKADIAELMDINEVSVSSLPSPFNKGVS